MYFTKEWVAWLISGMSGKVTATNKQNKIDQTNAY